MMVPPTAKASSRPRDRITGVVYLLYFLTAIAGGLLIKGLVVPGDPTATANNLLIHEPLYRSGVSVGLLGTAFYVAVTALFYDLFKPMSKRVSLLGAFLGLVGCAVQASGSVFQIAPLVLLGGGQSSSGFTTEQLPALALLFLKLHTLSTNTELVFFAFYDVLLGLLIFRSGFLPRLLGVLMILAGVGWLSALYPPLATRLSPYIQVFGFLAEVALMIWLIAAGVNVARWQERVQAEQDQQA